MIYHVGQLHKMCLSIRVLFLLSDILKNFYYSNNFKTPSLKNQKVKEKCFFFDIIESMQITSIE